MHSSGLSWAIALGSPWKSLARLLGEIPGTSPGPFPGKRYQVMESSVVSRVKLAGKAWVIGAKSWLGLVHSWRHPGESALVIPGGSWGHCCKNVDGMSVKASGHAWPCGPCGRCRLGQISAKKKTKKNPKTKMVRTSPSFKKHIFQNTILPFFRFDRHQP